jgi:hypothetical protein
MPIGLPLPTAELQLFPHMLRHTFVTTMLDAGVDLRDVQIAARHADPRTTMRHDRARNNLDRHPNYHPGRVHGLRHLTDGPAQSSPLPMAGLYTVEVEPQVRSWLERLSDRDFGRADFLVGLLAEQADTLGEPYARHLVGKVRELRFHLLARQPRITCEAEHGPAHDTFDREAS